MANRGFDNIPEKGNIPANFKILARSARASNSFIYHKPTKKWFTPDEFENGVYEIEQSRTYRSDNASDFSIVKPEFILKQRIEWVDKANKELQRIIFYMDL